MKVVCSICEQPFRFSPHSYEDWERGESELKCRACQSQMTDLWAMALREKEYDNAVSQQ